MPDLINYFLTGKSYTEMTIASTTQLFELENKKYSNDILESYGIDKSIFPEVIEPGKVVGILKILN